MKIKKLLGLILAGATLATLPAFAACGTPEDGGKNNGTLRMEAEYINLDDAQGAGISSNQAGVAMIHGDGDATDKEKWSEGYYVGYTYATGLELTFEFNSDIATTATLTLLLGSELGDIDLVPEKFGIRVNGEDQSYGIFKVYNSADMEAAEFDECVLPSPINLVAGKNTVTLVIYENDYKSGATGGPMIDYIEVKSANANLTWTPKTDNPSKRGEI